MPTTAIQIAFVYLKYVSPPGGLNMLGIGPVKRCPTERAATKVRAYSSTLSSKDSISSLA